MNKYEDTFNEVCANVLEMIAKNLDKIEWNEHYQEDETPYYTGAIDDVEFEVYPNKINFVAYLSMDHGNIECLYETIKYYIACKKLTKVKGLLGKCFNN